LLGATPSHAFDKEVEAMMKMIPNYPRGIVAVPWRRKGVLNWNVYYTQPDTIGAEERKIGRIIKARDNCYVIPDYDHPPLNSQHRAVWWLFGAAVGLARAAPTEEEEQ